MWDVTGRFLGTKLSPAFGTGMSLVAGRGLFQEDEEAYFGATEAAKQLLMPLTVKDIYEAMLEQGIPSGTAMSMLAIFGVGVQTYKPKEPKERKPSTSGGSGFGKGFDTGFGGSSFGRGL
jgi:hypothetical protein